MKHIMILCLVLLSFGLMSQYAYAVSQKECAIWLCLPAGFPEGCSGAYSAMKRRLRKDQSALPPFSACSVSDKQLLNKKRM